MIMFRRFLLLLALALLTLFSASNLEPIPIRFLGWQSPELPAFLPLIFAFLAGAVVALIWQSSRNLLHAADRKKNKPEKKQPAEKPAPAAASAVVEDAATTDETEPHDREGDH